MVIRTGTTPYTGLARVIRRLGLADFSVLSVVGVNPPIMVSEAAAPHVGHAIAFQTSALQLPGLRPPPTDRPGSAGASPVGRPPGSA